jgi:hypothetical protein
MQLAEGAEVAFLRRNLVCLEALAVA